MYITMQFKVIFPKLDFSNALQALIALLLQFVRRMLRQALILVANKKWTSAPQLAEVLWSTVLSGQFSK